MTGDVCSECSIFNGAFLVFTGEIETHLQQNLPKRKTDVCASVKKLRHYRTGRRNIIGG